MKRTLGLLLVILLSSFVSNGQEVAGDWSGKINAGAGIQMTIVFHVKDSAGALSSTMDSPDQGTNGIPTTSTSFENGKLKIEIKTYGISFEGELKGNRIEGDFLQGPNKFPLVLENKTYQKPKRPQEPKKPFPYYSEDVKFFNETDSVELAGTLTLPSKEGNFPVIILISGSGPQNRDEEILGHKPFLVLSDYFTREGFAVLRYDDRGTAESSGSFAGATSLDFTRDTEAAVNYLRSRKEINKDFIGLMGHSEGGVIAPIVASKQENDIAFVVSLAGLGVTGKEVSYAQVKTLNPTKPLVADFSKSLFDHYFSLKANGLNPDELKHQLELKLSADLESKFKGISSGDPKADSIMVVNAVASILNPWYEFFLSYDPTQYLGKVECPVFALNGELDMQVDAKSNLAGFEKHLKAGGNDNIQTVEYKGLNHLFQECKTGLPDEYVKIEQTFSYGVMDDILEWLRERGIVKF